MFKEHHVGGILLLYYKAKHPGVPYEKIPSWYKRTVIGTFAHTMRKWICQVWAPNTTINALRIGLYRICGFKIGKGCFIGMKCYLDDVCPEKLVIEDNVTVSYGVYFSCHGHKQGHHKIVIHDKAYIGMRANIIARKDIEIGRNSIVGAGALVNVSVPEAVTVVGVPAHVIKTDETKCKG